MSGAYLVLVEGDDGAFNVSAPDLPGLHATGQTIEDAIANTVEAVGEWMSSVSPHPGWTPPKPRTEAQLMEDLDVIDALENGALLVPLGRPAGD